MKDKNYREIPPQRLLGLSMEDPSSRHPISEVARGLKTRLCDNLKALNPSGASGTSPGWLPLALAPGHIYLRVAHPPARRSSRVCARPRRARKAGLGLGWGLGSEDVRKTLGFLRFRWTSLSKGVKRGGGSLFFAEP